MDTLMGLAVGLLAGGLVVWALRRGARSRAPEVKVHASVEELRALGELSVFKVLTKEIVTARDHWAGDFGKRYLEWLFTSKKMAMIFAFDIDFRYDLRDPEFRIEPAGDGFKLTLPPLRYDLNIRDITFYDEQKGRVLPWLLPDLVTAVFGAGFDEADRNRLKDEARAQAESLAANLVRRLRPEVQSSARETLVLLARGFTGGPIEVVFREAQPVQAAVEFSAAAG